MIAPETLLRMLPVDALRAQIGEIVKPPLSAYHLRIGKPSVVSGKTTTVPLTLDKSRAPVELWDRVGDFELTYERIDLGEFTSSLNRTVKSALPTTPVNILNGAFYTAGIPVVDEDLVPAEFTQLGAVPIMAGDESYRWVGEANFIIAQLGIEILPLIVVNTFSLSFTKDFRSADIKNRLATQLSISNASSLPTTILPGMFTLSDPEVNGPIASGDNTKLTLTFNGMPYIGGFSLTYARRGFENTFRFPIKVSSSGTSNVKQLSGILSNQMGCVITPEDIVSGQFPSIAVGQTVKFPVTIEPTSLAYVGDILVEYTRTN